MSQPKPVPAESLSEWFRAHWRTRAAGIVLTILVELMLALVLLTLVPSEKGRKVADRTLNTFDINPVTAPVPSAPEPARAAARPAEPPDRQPPVPIPAPPVPIAPPPIPPPPILPPPILPPVATVPAPAPAPAPGRKFGPPDTASSSSGDTPRVEGSGPNGEPLYAAAWYREPYDDELRGYLSTATGPGWGLIACRTVPDFRVEDCVALAEYPERSNIARAVLAAAWQFRVRPPRFRGQPRIGEWVRIRIDYDLKRR